MQDRITRRLVTFLRPFSLAGLGEQPAGTYAVETIEAHRWLHDTEPFHDNLFELWVEILDETLDGGWNGPMTESARRRGRGLAWAMAKRLTGHTPRRTA